MFYNLGQNCRDKLENVLFCENPPLHRGQHWQRSFTGYDNKTWPEAVLIEWAKGGKNFFSFE